MKFPWRQPSADEPEDDVDKTPVQTSIDITIPRECIYKRFQNHPGPCPRCGGPLLQSFQAYLIGTRRGRRVADSFIASNDAGWFCSRCPTMVTNPDEMFEPLEYGLPNWDIGDELTVLGLVDLDAVPEEKRDLPLGDDDNPVPLIEFTNVSGSGESKSLKRAQEASAMGDVSDASALTFEERYEDVLQNIEFGIVTVYRDHPEMTDWDALNAVEALIRVYNAEVKGRQIKAPSLPPLAQQIYESAGAMCELRLGRETLLDAEDRPVDLDMPSMSLDEIIACLKRIRKSINLWSREGGRQGYLTYVDRFIA